MRGEEYRRFLDPRLVSQLKGLDLKARLIVEGFLIGLHRSPLHGFSVEFREHRPYSIGDELRWIDWKVYARTDRFYIKKFEEETNLKAYILFDSSKSMDYPPENPKLEYAKSLAAALAYLLHLQRDAVGLLVFAEKVREYLPPSSTRKRLEEIFLTLSNLKAEGRTDPSKVMRIQAERIKKRGLIILISDLMMEPEKIIKGLKNFRHRKHEVLVFHILSKKEYELPESPSLFEDMETKEKIPYDPERMKEKYRIAFNEFRDKLKRELRASLIEYESMTTETPFNKALLAYLKKRERMP